MISNSRIVPTLPAVDLGRAKKFYHEKLGLKVTMEDPMGIMFESRNGFGLYLYKRGATRADHTVASFDVEDIVSEVGELRREGIKFEEYDIPEMGLKTIDGIATYGGEEYSNKSAWFKDTEGNILALVSMVKVGGESGRKDHEAAGARR